MSAIFLTKEEAYLAMFQFLKQVYDQTNDNGIGSLLSCMVLRKDGSPIDPAYEQDWIDAIKRVKPEWQP